MVKYARLKNIENSLTDEFKTIGEVSSELKIPQHVLRFWQSKFSNYIKPLKRKGGHRYYRPKDISKIKQIKTLLYDEGFTIKGAQKFLRKSKPQENLNNINTTETANEESFVATNNDKQQNMFENTSEINLTSDKSRVEGFIKELESVKDMLNSN